MKPGIEKQQILEKLNGMMQNLDDAECSLIYSMNDIRSDLYKKQFIQMEALGNQLAAIESKATLFNYSTSHIKSIQDAPSLKLELGF